MPIIQRVVSFLFGVFIIVAGYHFHDGIPKVGATGEAVNIGGKFYPTSLVLWIFWIITLGVAGLYFLYALRPVRENTKQDK